MKLRELKTHVFRIMDMSATEIEQFKQTLGASDVDSTARGFMIRAIELRLDILSYTSPRDTAMVEHGEQPRED